MISDMSSWLKSVSQQVLSGRRAGLVIVCDSAGKQNPEYRKEEKLTVQSDVMHGQDDGSVVLGDPLHRAADSSIWSLHIVLL